MSRSNRRRSLLPVEPLEPRSLLANAFPEAEGFGALATGGRGGTVYHVTNLNDTGAGSFRDAVSGSNRTVVFDVGGVITINSQVAFSNNITVEGQTAPGGIVVYGDGVSLSNRNNIIVRYMTFRQGLASGSGDKALNITNGYNMILDHVSIAWGRWDTFGITDNSHDITFQNCIMAEGIDPQNFGGLIDSSSNLTLARNLFINNNSRNPKGKAHMQYINNVIYNWGSSGYVGGHSSAPWNQDLISNYWIAGPSSSLSGYLSGFASTDQIYNSGNYLDSDKTDVGGDGLPEGNLVSDSEFTSRSATINASAYNNPAVATTVMTAQQAYQYVRDNVGNSFRRDAADTRLIGYLKSQGSKGAIIDDEATVAGQPPVFAGTALADTDGDGMPNVWESANGTDPNVADNNGDVNADGYTNLENYVNGIIAAGLPAGTPTVQNAAAAGALVGATSNITVLGADDSGEAGLTYTWASSGPGSVGFSANGSNAAKNITATFNRAGTFALVVKIQDAAGSFTTSSVYVTVAAVYTSLTISPSTANLSPTQTQQFTATMRDQFGQSMGTAPAPSWQMVSGGGSIDSNGLYTAPAAPGSAVVRGGYNGKTGTANITIVNPGAVIQAETQTIGGSGTVVEATNAGFNGTGYINFGTSNGFLQFNGVQGGSGGSTTIRFRYAMGVAARTGLLLVNGVSQGNVTFPTTSAWTTYTTIQLTVPLNVGATNTIRLETIGSGDMANVDELQVDINVPPSSYTGTANGDTYYLKRSGTYLQIWAPGNGTGSPTYTIDYSLESTLSFNGSGGDDTLIIDNSAGNAIPTGGVTFDGGTGALDSLVVVGTSGVDSTTFDSSAVSANGSVNLSNVELRKLTTNGNADGLTINSGPVTLMQTGKFSTLAIAAGGSVDIGTVGLAQDYNSGSPLGEWGDTAYSGVTGLVQSGKITSSAITSGLYGIGVGEASDVLGASGGAFGSETVDGSAVLVKFTYAGDANLDGKINIDDYTKIDTGIANAATGWSNGDFNYDGKINIDDYVIIDNNIANQGATLPNAAGVMVNAPALKWDQSAGSDGDDVSDQILP